MSKKTNNNPASEEKAQTASAAEQTDDTAQQTEAEAAKQSEDKKPEEAIRLCKLFMQMVRGEIPEDDPSLADLEDASILKDIAHMPARVKCAELAWRTLEEMLENK